MMSSRHATALGALTALVSGLVGLVPAATASPDVRPVAASGPHDLPTVYPTPRRIRSTGPDIVLPAKARLITVARADPAALRVAREALERAGVEPVGPAAGPAPAGAEIRLTYDRSLPAEGYRVTVEQSGTTRIALAARDSAGMFYAAQTFRQLLRKRAGRAYLPSVAVEDSPSFPFRGGEESFYGQAWSWDDRYDQVDFLASHKMNYFFYGPAADDRTTGRGWNRLYSAEDLGRFRDLIAYAAERHVRFIYRIGPAAPAVGGSAPGICHSDPTHRDALRARLEQMWSVGVRRFVISWDDIGGFSCAADTARYGTGPRAQATAQAEVLNTLQTEFFDEHPDVEPGLTIPMEYWTNDPTEYRSRFDELVTTRMQLYWTGPAVMAKEIEAPDVQAIQRAFPRHKLLVFDNYPVHDYDENLLHLGPIDNRGPNIAQGIVGISWNEMHLERASHLALATQADYAWNSEAYDAERSFTAGIAEIGGTDPAALRVVADLNRFDPILNGIAEGTPGRQAPDLAELVDSFRTTYTGGGDVTAPADALSSYIGQIATAPGRVRTSARADFVGQIEPWLVKTERTAPVLRSALETLRALADKDFEAAARSRGALDSALSTWRADPRKLGIGVVEPFAGFAAKEYDELTARALRFSAPKGAQTVARGRATPVAINVEASDRGVVNGTLTASGPPGWSISPATRQIELASHGRAVRRQLWVDVTAPPDAPGTAHALDFRLQTTDGRTLDRRIPLYPATDGDRSYRDLVLASAPRVYYRMDDPGDALTDSSGNGRHGRYRNRVVHGVGGATSDGNDAVAFEGGFAQIENSVGGVAPTGPFTVEAWVRPEIVAGGDGQGIVEKYTIPGRSGFVLRFAPGNVLQACVLSATAASCAQGGPGVGASDWHHVATTYDGGSLRLYLDGIEVHRAATTVRPAAGPSTLLIGARGDDRNMRFDGAIDEVALYPSALGGATIAEHFLSGHSLSGGSPRDAVSGHRRVG